MTESSHARERRWPVGSEINVNSRRPVMRVKAGDIWDLEWLSEWDTEREDCFVLSGMESVQKAFADLFLDGEQPLGVKLAEEVAEHLVTARFMELVAAAHKAAKRRYAGIKGLPVIATAHDWDTVHMTE